MPDIIDILEKVAPNAIVLDDSFPRQPIIEFETKEELDASLKEWQERLFLHDWIIQVQIKQKHELLENDCDGCVCCNWVRKSAKIELLEKECENPVEVKFCQEKTLVHELLHCVYFCPELDKPTIEEVYHDVKEHSIVEQLAKSLIMAKYNIPFDWFKNF